MVRTPNMDGTNKIEDTVLNISKYECGICDKIYRDKLSLKQHCEEYHRDDLKEEPVRYVASMEHQEKQYDTNAVETIKIEETELNYGEAEFECNICDIIFTDQFSLEHHVNECHQDYWKENPTQPGESSEQLDDVKWKCDNLNCEKSFKTKSELNRHLVIHKNKRPFKCQQTGCTKSFKRKDKLKNHIKTVHNEEKSFKCEETGCTKSFNRKDYLISHMKVHSNAKPFKCKHKGCTMSFKWQTQLNQHMVVHSEHRPFKCPHMDCKWSFKRRVELKYHMRSHSDETPFLCQQPGCTKSYKCKRKLTKHERKHNHKILIKLEKEKSAVENKPVFDMDGELKMPIAK